MPSSLPEIKVRFVDQESLDRVRVRADEAGVSVAAFLLLCAGEPYPEHGGARKQKQESKMASHTPSHRETLIRQREMRITELTNKGEGKNSRRQNVINRLRRELKCLRAGDHLSNWVNYKIDP